MIDLEDEDNVKDELVKYVVILSFKFNFFQSLEYDQYFFVFVIDIIIFFK